MQNWILFHGAIFWRISQARVHCLIRWLVGTSSSASFPDSVAPPGVQFSGCLMRNLCFDREVDLLPSRNKAEHGHATLFSGGDPCSMIAVVFKNLPCIQEILFYAIIPVAYVSKKKKSALLIHIKIKLRTPLKHK